ncbi:MAG: hypothetical protein EOP04_01555 [Proteobacteria bacterium]|nr:MAG: hypothetical protein EOP04_01555 [Pseudomonadota bacterium]
MNTFKNELKSHQLAIFLLFAITCLMLSIPIQFQKREIMPFGMHRLADFNTQTAIPVSDQVSFRFAVSGDIQLLKKPMFAEDLSDQAILKNIPENKLNKPNLKIQRLGFKLATYQQKLKCTSLQVQLDGGLKSKPLSCAQIHDNEISYFEFKQAINPGLYDAKILGDLKSPLAIYASPSEAGVNWVPVHYQKKNGHIATLLFDWSIEKPVSASLYLLLFLVSSYILAVGKYTKSKLILLMITLGFSFLLIIPFFSGHDETAHLTMMKKAFSSETEDVKFNNDSFHSMIENDFYRLHNARILDNGECPHKILFKDSCGISERPLALYQFYGNLLKALNFPSIQNPHSFLALGRAFNWAWVTIVGLILIVAFGESASVLLLFYMLFCGTFLSQVSSISNDPPMYLLGFSIAVCLVHMIQKPKLTNLFVFILLTAYLIVARKIDRSAVAAVPGLLALLLLVPMQFKGLQPKSKFRPLNILLLVVSLTLMLAVGLNWKPISSALSLDLISWLNRLTDDAYLLNNINKFDMWAAVNAVGINMESALGSFIWGHSPVPDIYIQLIFTVFVILTIFGISHGKKSKLINVAAVLAIAVLMVGQSMVILSAQLSELNEQKVVFDSFLKVRLTAPGFAVFMIPASIGLLSIYKEEKWRPILIRAFSFWVIVWQLYLLPYAILKELY